MSKTNKPETTPKKDEQPKPSIVPIKELINTASTPTLKKSLTNVPRARIRK